MDQTIEIPRVSIRSFRNSVCAENFRVVMGLCSGTSSETCFSSPSQPWYGQFPPGCMEQKRSHSQGVWISSLTSCPMQIEPLCSSLPRRQSLQRLCCVLWERSGAFPFHLYFNCSACVQVPQRPFRKYLPESGLISTMGVYAIKRCPEPTREVREEPKYLYHFKKMCIPKPLNLD